MNRVFTFSSILGAISVALFISIELGAAAIAAGWAVSGLLSLGPRATAVLAVLLAIPTLYAIARVSMMAFDAETDPANN